MTYSATDWPEQGNLDGSFCLVCHSHFCPHAAPSLYSERTITRPTVTAPALEYTSIPARAKEKITREADRRESQKGGYASTRRWTGGDTHLPGLVGEWFYGSLIGEEPDWTLRVAGDDGVDFKSTEVKCSTFVADPDLKVSDGELAKPALYYVLVVWDQPEDLVAYGGYATKPEVASARKKDYGNGLMYAINWRSLRSGFPHTEGAR